MVFVGENSGKRYKIFSPLPIERYGIPIYIEMLRLDPIFSY
jgi:hypothetical protein